MILKKFVDHLDAKIECIDWINQSLLKITIYSPYAAKNFSPGQFFKLQTYQNNILSTPIILTGGEISHSYISLFANVFNKNSPFISLQKNDHVLLLGPLGSSFPSFNNSNILCISDHSIGDVCFFSVVNDLYKKNCHINYIYENKTIYKSVIKNTVQKLYESKKKHLIFL